MTLQIGPMVQLALFAQDKSLLFLARWQSEICLHLIYFFVVPMLVEWHTHTHTHCVYLCLSAFCLFVFWLNILANLNPPSCAEEWANISKKFASLTSDTYRRSGLDRCLKETCICQHRTVWSSKIWWNEIPRQIYHLYHFFLSFFSKFNGTLWEPPVAEIFPPHMFVP